MKNIKIFNLNYYVFILFLIGAMLTSSCATLRTTDRLGKDTFLTSRTFKKIEGTYSNSSQLNNSITFYNQIQDQTESNLDSYSIQIIPISKKRIEVKLMSDDILISSTILKGRYRNGYFKIKSEWDASLMAGPLIWGLYNEITYIGLTKEKNLVVLNAGGGVTLLVAFPIFAADRPQVNYIYERKE